MKLRILSQEHDRAAEGPLVVDDGFSAAEDVFEYIHIYPGRVVLDQTL